VSAKYKTHFLQGFIVFVSKPTWNTYAF